MRRGQRGRWMGFDYPLSQRRYSFDAAIHAIPCPYISVVVKCRCYSSEKLSSSKGLTKWRYLRILGWRVPATLETPACQILKTQLASLASLPDIGFRFVFPKLLVIEGVSQRTLKLLVMSHNINLNMKWYITFNFDKNATLLQLFICAHARIVFFHSVLIHVQRRDNPLHMLLLLLVSSAVGVAINYSGKVVATLILHYPHQSWSLYETCDIINLLRFRVLAMLQHVAH